METDCWSSATWDLVDFDKFGRSLASLGDVDGDGVVDVAVGTQARNDGGTNRGALIMAAMPELTKKTSPKRIL